MEVVTHAGVMHAIVVLPQGIGIEILDPGERVGRYDVLGFQVVHEVERIHEGTGTFLPRSNSSPSTMILYPPTG